MRELMDYIFTGLIALILLFVTSPLLIDFYDQALTAVGNSSEMDGSTQGLITSVFLLVVIIFYLMFAYGLYATVQKRFDIGN